jgi:hypothetical protein
LFAQLESLSQGTDLRPVVLTATFVMSLSTRGEAEQALRDSDYRPPEEVTSLPFGSELSDAPEESSIGGEIQGQASDDAGHPGQTPVMGDDAKGSGSSGSAAQGTGGKPREPKAVDEDSEASGKDTRGSGPAAAAGADSYQSNTDAGAFGAKPKASTAGATSRGDFAHGHGSEVGASEPKADTEAQPRDTRRERHTRRSRYLTYVATGTDHSDQTKHAGDDKDNSDLIDVAAITAVVKYEQKRGWSPDEQPHGNPGWDIVSRSPDGTSHRLIEVKGLDGEWTERGIKLTHVQYGMAEAHPEEFWIYVVEHARDLERQRVTAIANPFSKVEEYWFDDRWRRASEENASARDLNLMVGARVKHDTWGVGTIVDVKYHGIAPFLTVDFGQIEGRRGIPYSSHLKFVD